MNRELGSVDLSEVAKEMREQFPPTSDQLIPILQHVQGRLGYLPGEAMRMIAEYLKVPRSHVYGVATFYAQFRFKPLGKNRITVCRGTACHVRGSGRLVEELERELGIKAGDTTDDLKFSLETVACLGSCALAPVVVINDKVYGKMNAKAVKRVLAKLDRLPEKATAEKPELEKAKPEAKAEAPEKEKPAAPAKKKAKPKAKPKKSAGAKRAKKSAKKKTVKKAAKKAAGKTKKAAKKKAAKKSIKKAAKKKAAKKSAKKKPAAKKKQVKKSAVKKKAAKKSRAGKRK